VVGRAGDHQRRALHGLEDEPRAESPRARGDGEIDLPAGHQPGHRALVGGDHVHLYLRVVLVEAAEGLDDVGRAWGHHHGHADAPAQHTADLGDRVPGLPGGVDRRPGRLEEGAAGVGQLRATPAADEQLGTDRPLEGEDRCRQARLHHEHAGRSAGERPFVGDGQKVFQLSQFHNRYPTSPAPCRCAGTIRDARLPSSIAAMAPW
jgi:hypothetical protein